MRCASRARSRAAAERKGEWGWRVAALAFAALGVALRAYRIDQPISGYLAFNEGFYLSIAAKDVGRGILAPLLSPADLNNSPLYPLLLAWVAKAFGPTVAAARWLSVAWSGSSVLLTYGLGRRLYNKRVGLAAAAALAFMPGHALVGRNVQNDALLVMLELAAVYAYVRAAGGSRGGWLAASGILFGLALFAKLPAALLVPCLAAWELWRADGFRVTWVRRLATVTAIGIALPAVWYALQLLGGGGLVGAQSRLAATGGWRGLRYLWDYVALEIWWMLSPVLGVVSAAGLAKMTADRRAADKLVLAWCAVHLGVLALYNYHSYYCLPLAPFLAIAAGRTIGAVTARRPVVAAAATISLAVVMSVFAFVMLAGKKYGTWSPASIERAIAASGVDPGSSTVVVDDGLWGIYGPAMQLYAPRARLIHERPLPGDRPLADGPWYLVSELPGVTPVIRLSQPRVRLVLFGLGITQEQGRFNYFSTGRWDVRRLGPVWRFGTQTSFVPSDLQLYAAGGP